MVIKGPMKGLQKKPPDFQEPWSICILTKATKIPRGPTIDVSKFAPGFMPQMNFVYFTI